jgi:hypothetical protein
MRDGCLFLCHLFLWFIPLVSKSSSGRFLGMFSGGFSFWLVFWLRVWSYYNGMLDPESLLNKFRGDGGSVKNGKKSSPGTGASG